MKKYFVFLLVCLMGVSAFGQTKISMRSIDKAECEKSDYSSLRATFSFSGIETTEMNSERGVFSILTMPNTVIGGNEGDPQIPVVSKLIAVPVGATPSIRVTSYSTMDYDLDEYGIHRLSPRQPDVWKNQRPEDVPFVYNEAAYQTRGLRSEPMARVSVDGTMRGVQVGRMSIEPVSYDPVNNKIRVFNDIKVEVVFDGADARATEDMLISTYSPYFDVLYKQLFNGRAVRDVYDQHPDLWQAPVKMLVIANRMFENCIQDWLAWKTMKGIYVDVNYTDNIGTSADAIKSFIQNKYAQNAPTFLMIMGDKDQVAPSVTSASKTSRVSDLYYSSVDGDEFVDMFHSRLSATTTAEMTAMLNKGMEYEQYTMPDPSYLNKVLLIAGDDDGWGVTVGRPTIWYATNYYYNAEHGFDNVYEFSHGTYTNCYAPLSSGVGFANYTAHGSQTSWAGPEFDVDDVQSLTNEHKYFLAMGNCCQSGDWGFSTCFGEAMTRAENKGAYAYIGSCPNTTWKNDYYFGVGPTNRADGTMPTYEETGLGCYDAIWMDDVYNTVNSILYVGLLAGNAAGALGYELHSATLYYWQAYHVLGDGSIMPYRVQPTANNVSHMAILPIGMSTYEVSAVPGSYVAISKDGVLLGAALVDEDGTVQVPITPVTTSGDVTICVTAPNRIPYIHTVPAAALEGAYISVDSYTPTETHVGDDTNLSITFKNVGTDASIGTTNVTLSTEDPNVTLNNYTGSFGVLAADATTTVSGFSFSINPGVADGTNVTIHYTAVNGDDTFEGNIVVKANEAVLEYAGMVWDGGFTPGETLTVSAKFKNTGHWQATNAQIALTSSSDYVTVNTQPISAGTLEVGQEVTYAFSITIASNCPETAQLPITFTMNANGGLSTTGNETLKNACNIVFNLSDSYGDGWNGSSMTVSFSDGSPSQTLTISSGNSAVYTLEIGNGTHVTLTWTSGSQWDSECSFIISYEDGLIIYQSNGTPSAGVLYEFDCNCGTATQTFTVTATSSNIEQGTVSGGGEYSYGETCTVSATPAEGYSFMNWTRNGEVVSTTATYSFEVTSDVNLVANFIGRLTVSVSANPEEGGTVTVSNGGKRAQLVYDFEDGTSQGWTLLKGSAGDSPNNWMHVTEYTPRDYTSGKGHNSSDGFMLSESYISGETEGTGTPVYPDNYLVSPQVQLGGSISFWASNVNDNYGEEHFAVAVSMSGNSNVSDFTQVQEWTLQPSSKASRTGNTRNIINGTWYEYTVDLSDFSGMGYVTIHHFNCYDMWLLCIDDITIVEGTTGGGDTPNPNVTSASFDYGESCTVTAVPNEGYFFVNWTENGTMVSSSASYTFAVTNDRNLVANFAEGILIGDGSTETREYLPSYNYYNHSLTEQIYTPEELGAAGFITSIAFYNGGAEKTLDYEFYMKSTEKDLFTSDTDWEAVTEADKVFSGRVVMVANDWTTIVFSTPFAYDGTSNVVLVTNKNTNYTNSPHMSCRVFDAPSQAIYAYSDGVSYNPMTPPTSYGNSGSYEYHDVLSVKNQLLITKTGFDGCVNTTPTNVEVGNITNSAATVTWTGFSESYNVSLGIANITTLVNTDFTESIPANWTNDATYPWTIVDGHIQSGNAGEHGSTSSISLTLTYPADGTIEFDAECKGEGTSTYWDHCDFIIDETTQLTAGANISGWNHYVYDVTAGEHTFTWSYTKDGSVNPDGDYFAVDNVLMKAGEITWNAPIAAEDVEYTFSGLTPETAYCVRVQGVCDDNASEWSDIIFFTTTAMSHFVFDGDWNDPANWNPASVPEEGDDVIIDASATIPSGYVANVGNITLGEDGSITIQDGGQLIHTNSMGDDVTVTIEKDIVGYGESTNNEHYYFIAPAPFNQTKLPTQVENMLENEYDLYSFSPIVDDGLEWINYKNPQVTNFKLRSAHGYLYANSDDVTLSVTGPAISSTSGGASLQFNYNPDASYMFRGWRLAGNPYLCNGYVYFTDNNNEIIQTEFYQMNENGDGYDQITSADPLKPFEGVFVYSENSGTIKFSPEPIMSRAGALTMNLSQNGDRVDMVRIRFGQGQNLAKRSFRENSSKVYMTVSGKDYATVFSTEMMGEMPVNFKAEESGSFTLSFSLEAVNFSYLHLIDTLTGNDIDLLQTPSYRFEASTTDTFNRFKVVFVRAE